MPESIIYFPDNNKFICNLIPAMQNHSLTLLVSELKLAICRLPPEASLPFWIKENDFFSVTRTQDELSIICKESQVPGTVQAERNWRMIKVSGPLDFGLTGVLASLSHPLADAGISIFALSTFETDYLLLKEEHLNRATGILGRKHTIVYPDSKAFAQIINPT